MFKSMLKGDRLYLSRLKEEELTLLHQLYEDKGFMQDYGYIEGMTQTYEELKCWYGELQTSATEIFYSIYDKQNNQWIGFISLIDVNRLEQEAWLVIGLIESSRQKGIGKESIQTLLKEIANQGIKTVRLSVLGHNDRAIHLYEKLGFQIETIYPKNSYPNIFQVDILELSLNIEPLK